MVFGGAEAQLSLVWCKKLPWLAKSDASWCHPLFVLSLQPGALKIAALTLMNRSMEARPLHRPFPILRPWPLTGQATCTSPTRPGTPFDSDKSDTALTRQAQERCTKILSFGFDYQLRREKSGGRAFFESQHRGWSKSSKTQKSHLYAACPSMRLMTAEKSSSPPLSAASVALMAAAFSVAGIHNSTRFAAARISPKSLCISRSGNCAV